MQETGDFVTFSEEIFNGKLLFLCSGTIYFDTSDTQMQFKYDHLETEVMELTIRKVLDCLPTMLKNWSSLKNSVINIIKEFLKFA